MIVKESNGTENSARRTTSGHSRNDRTSGIYLDSPRASGVLKAFVVCGKEFLRHVEYAVGDKKGGKDINGIMYVTEQDACRANQGGD